MRAVVKCALTVAILFVLFAFNQAGATPVASAFSIPGQSAAADTTYLVQQGDTYYSLSRRFSIPLDSLQKWNGTQLQMGQTLYLTNRKAKAKTTAAKPAATPAAQASIASQQPKATVQPSTAQPAQTAVAKPNPQAAKPATASQTTPPSQAARPATTPPAQSAKAVSATNTTGPARTQVSTSAAASTLPTLESKEKQRILVVPFRPISPARKPPSTSP